MTVWPLSDRLRDYLMVQYELLRVLGTGGMGAVLLAREHALDRLVAIKVLHADKASDAESRERFRREARAAAKLTHPNIVPLLTFGEVEGELYYVMGYVEGETLGARLEREGRFSAMDARQILSELAEALGYAHRAGIVHRDLKPENVLIDAVTGRAMLTDFGIARDLGREASLTSTGIIVGTPHYMSPEQASGDRSTDGRTDIYSLGVIGYRMLSGTLPFGGADVRQVIAQHLSAAPAPMPREVEEESPTLTAAIRRALAKLPADRWADGALFAFALRAGDGEVPEELEMYDGVMASSSLISLVGSLAVGVVSSLTGLAANFAESVGFGAMVAVVGPAAAFLAWRLARFRSPETAGVLRRIVWHPPRWWRLWWPARARRVGDVWDRLPTGVQRFRLTNGLAGGIVAPAMIGVLLWLWTPRGSQWYLEAIVLRRDSWVLLGPLLALSGGITVTFGVWFQVLHRRLGVDRVFLNKLLTLPVVDRHWSEPRFAAFLRPLPAVRAAASAMGTETLLRALREAGVVLPEGMTEALAAVTRGERALERELRGLREMVNASELERLDARLAKLGSGDPRLREMLESQRALLARAEERIAELGALKSRLEAQQALLRQQLITLRDLAPSGADLSEITGRIRALNEDLCRLTEGLAESISSSASQASRNAN